MAEAPRHKFRVTREFTGTPLTASQQRVLAALVSLCPDSGSDADARAVAKTADARLGSVVVVLRSLEKRRLALVHEGAEGETDTWAPTMTGRSRVRHFPDPGAAERQRAPERTD